MLRHPHLGFVCGVFMMIGCYAIGCSSDSNDSDGSGGSGATAGEESGGSSGGGGEPSSNGGGGGDGDGAGATGGSRTDGGSSSDGGEPPTEGGSDGTGATGGTSTSGGSAGEAGADQGGAPSSGGTGGSGGTGNEAAIEAGAQLAENKACGTSCHGDDFAGNAFYPNLTPDDETGLGTWTDEEIIDAIREGADPDGGELCGLMERYEFTDEEAANLVAFLRSLPAKDSNQAGECPVP